MKRFRVIEFTSAGTIETENKLNQEVKEDEKIIHISVEKNPGIYARAVGGLIIRAILEKNS